MKLKLFLMILFLTNFIAFAQDVSVVLKNSKVVFGRVVEEKPEHIILITDLGEIKIDRANIQTITFNPFTEIKSPNSDDDNDKLIRAYKFSLKDPVVVYFRNGNVKSGILLAKSLDMVMLQTESGNLTVNKKDIQKIEYISSEYAERGEIVVAHLINGQRYQGNIYFEDSNELTLDTELGRLSIPKNKLRMIEYTGKKVQLNLLWLISTSQLRKLNVISYQDMMLLMLVIQLNLERFMGLVLDLVTKADIQLNNLKAFILVLLVD